MLEPKIEDVDIKEMWLYYSDFSEVNHLQVNIILGNAGDISREDRNFFDILETSTKKAETHYEVPQPFRDTGVQLPDNRNQAAKRGII